MKTEFLNIVLLDEIDFEELIVKFKKAFEIDFVSKNEKGRLIAKGMNSLGDFKLIDKFDDLGDFLSDENHTLEIKINIDDTFKIEVFEDEIKKSFEKSNIKWKYGIWTKLTDFFDENRYLNPDSSS
ncbi:hypothetical protein [Flavobacterium oreochromis]|uniref:hypothetical protein n=1 Tax=Flavobacterium oreochromis TaxID=2906078 RepID=UPI000CDB3005|nr:hypothetical protein BWK58_14920 [Flavobacterium columnare]